MVWMARRFGPAGPRNRSLRRRLYKPEPNLDKQTKRELLILALSATGAIPVAATFAFVLAIGH